MNDLENFRRLGIAEATIEALRRKGFEEPTPIQARTIPLLLAGERDVIGQAQTGTGKTAAFGIPILDTITRGDGAPQALILSPTRELCIQIAEEIESLRGGRPLRIAPLYGGQSIEIQLQRLRDGVDIAVGTPGRILDLLRRERLRFDALRFTVLDEADEMLNMGFIEDIETILAATPAEKRMLMFSATMPPEIQSIAERFMRDPEVVRTRREDTASELTDQIYFEVRRENKLEALTRIIDMEEDIYAMIFCRTRNDVDELTEKLQFHGYAVEALHGDIAQAQRTKVIARFKERKFQLLIATDVAARGIDVNDLTHVINYSMPQGPETYIHRIGRTGRAGKSGVAITFVTPAEYRQLTRIKRETRNDIRREDLPQGSDVVQAKKQRFIERIDALLADDSHREYADFAAELVAHTGDPAAVVAAMLRLKFKDELLPETYRDLTRRRESAPDDRGRTRLFVGVGKLDGFGAVKLLDLIYEMTRIKSFRLGKVECYDKFSFVNARFEDAERIIDAFRRQRGPAVEIAREPGAAPEENDGDAAERTRRFKRRETADNRPRREARPHDADDRPRRKPAERKPAARKPAERKTAAPAAPRRKLRDLVSGDETPLKPKRVRRTPRD